MQRCITGENETHGFDRGHFFCLPWQQLTIAMSSVLEETSETIDLDVTYPFASLVPYIHAMYSAAAQQKADTMATFSERISDVPPNWLRGPRRRGTRARLSLCIVFGHPVALRVDNVHVSP